MQALPPKHSRFARLLQSGACARMRNAKLIQPRDRRQDRRCAVIDVIGDADRINARNFQRFGRRKRGKESLAVERVGGVRLVETTFEIAEDEISRLELVATFAKGSAGFVTFIRFTSPVRRIFKIMRTESLLCGFQGRTG